MTTAKKSTPRVDALRERRLELGLKRMELVAHPEDEAAIKAFAAGLQAARKRAAAAEQEYTAAKARAALYDPLLDQLMGKATRKSEKKQTKERRK